jgi:hypothetical protein
MSNMGQSRIITKTVTMTAAGGLAPVVRCWDAPEGEMFKNLGIIISSRGETLAAGNLDWAVFYGGFWTGGLPFESGSVHNGGVAPAASTGTIAGSAKVNSTVFTDAGPFLPNRPKQIPSGSGYIYEGKDGFPIVLQLTNAKAVALTVYVTFRSETVQDWR